MIPFPAKKYQIIYADPPWEYRNKAKKEIDARHHYQVQSLKWICNLPVEDITESDCCLFLWATSPMLPEAIQVVEAWGFRYVTIAFCWLKYERNSKSYSVAYRPGNWTMSSVELCLLAVKGSPNKWRQRKNIFQIISAHCQKHSLKPAEVRRRIVKLLGDRPRIEIFARQQYEGWDCWGNEICSDDNQWAKKTYKQQKLF
jgi:N6-adenosine-specific RNA methylase IME4